MGIPFKLYEGKEANLPAELTAGGIYFCEDSGNVFIDVDIDGTLTRVPLGKKYVDDQLKDIKEFIENQGSGIEIGSEPPTKESANVWIDTDDEDEEGVEYLGVVTSINGQGGDVNITASDIDAAEKTHAAQHAWDGSDPITPEAIWALAVNKQHYSGNIDEIFNGAYLALASATGDMPWTSKWFDLVAFPSGTGACSQIAMCTSSDGLPTEFKFRHHNGNVWSPWSTAATTDYALNKNSDTVTGQLYFDDWGSGTGKTMITTHDDRTHIRHERDANNSIDLMLSMEEEAFLGINRDGVYGNVTILHTGNKPSHYYQGTGGTWVEPLNTGGVGDVIFINKDGADVFAIVTREGALVKDAAKTVRGISRENANFKNGILTIDTNDDALNIANWRYNYQVL